MNLEEKLARAKQAVNSISRHDDQHPGGRRAVLEALKEHIDTELEAGEARYEERIAAAEAAAAEAEADEQ